MGQFITMSVLCRYLDGCSPDNMKPEVKLHGPFFSLCQAVFYVFVFRHKALLDSPDGELKIIDSRKSVKL